MLYFILVYRMYILLAVYIALMLDGLTWRYIKVLRIFGNPNISPPALLACRPTTQPLTNLEAPGVELQPQEGGWCDMRN